MRLVLSYTDPDWWNELYAWKQRDAMETDGEMGKAALAIVKPGKNPIFHKKGNFG